MSSEKVTLGQAIDQIIGALNALDKREQQTAIATVCTVLDLSPSLYSTPARHQAPSIVPNTLPPGDTVTPAQHAPKPPDHDFRHGIDIRSLREQKQPDSARQMACIVAYYLLEHAPEAERRQTVTPAEIEKYFKQAGYKLPSKLEQLLIDCKRAGYFEPVSRGEYKLTRVGYNLVTHSMPKASKG